MPKLEDLKKLEVFCRRKECGDPVVDRNGNIVYTKRTMNLVAVSAVFDRVTLSMPCMRCQAQIRD